MNKDNLGNSNFFEYPLTSMTHNYSYQNINFIDNLINNSKYEIPLTEIKYINIYPNLKKTTDIKLNEQSSVNYRSN